jgi:hypothetical protein
VKLSRTLLIPLLTLALASCGITALDNYDPPTAVLTGQVVYDQSPVGVRSDGVQLELWQRGFATPEKIPVYVDQDGSFSALLFDGSYDLTLLPGNGPWVDSGDTIHIELKGKADVEVPVTPYYTVEGEQIGASDGALSATFRVGQVDTSRAVEYVGLYVSTTAFVDRQHSVARAERARGELASLDDPVQMSVDLPADLAKTGQLFARVGVKTVGVAEMLYSPVHKIAL